MHAYTRAAGYGFATGLRTMSSPTALGNRRRLIVGLLIAAAIGELIADKLPFVPSRLSAPPLLGRVVVGGYAGWRASEGEASPLVGVACGAIAAVAGAVLGYRSRKFIVQRFGVPDLPVALVEDILAIGLVTYLRCTRG